MPSVYPNDPIISRSYQSPRSLWSGELLEHGMADITWPLNQAKIMIHFYGSSILLIALAEEPRIPKSDLINCFGFNFKELEI